MHLQQAVFVVLAIGTSLVCDALGSISYTRSVRFDWGHTKVRGVNIGGWLIVEPFITPGIFDKHSTAEHYVVDEWTLCEQLGKQDCYNVLKAHWDSFVSINDFRKIASAGFNVVRIPVGYWSYLDLGAPYTAGAAPYVDKAVEWARETGLKVIIDLHGAPGSQNGFDHSGQQLATPGWGKGETVNQTYQVLQILEDKYAKREMQSVVIGIQILNEPFLNKLNTTLLKSFYATSYTQLRQTSDTPLLIHDGFRPPTWLNNFLTKPSDHSFSVIVDHHEYQIFDPSLVALSPAAHLQQICTSAPVYSRSSDKWTIVGEWSGAMTDCAKYVNGFMAGNRYEGSWEGSWRVGSCAGLSGEVGGWSEEWKDDVRRYVEGQMDAFERGTDGWIFWNFKTEGSAGEWDLFQLLNEGVFPQPLDDRKFERVCG
ncbi:glycoside hydrolase family 5 protein [Lophiostoma macrostomum CBS 122681]|uniref:Glycoside hydrolase family 5 protein n=1 Tax=Lophiostoma macrostomum CBS 122681 TaxID=1314788 RepID=A0A6A6TFX8_9PLEO|nr:glycoside hydrolase family 5 protein [Lophiostoma macrostomum CBS 122681]